MHIKFNIAAINKLFEWGDGGHNWTALHKGNTEYENYNEDEILSEFKAEVSYTYDRMSLDRLFRTHWLFNQICKPS